MRSKRLKQLHRSQADVLNEEIPATSRLAMIEFGIETSALGRLLTDERCFGRALRGALKRRDVQLVLCENTLAECIGDGDSQRAQEQARKLVALGDVLGGRLGFAVTLRRLLRLECQQQRFGSTPIRTQDELTFLRKASLDPDFVRFHTQQRRRGRAREKAEWLRLEEGLAREEPLATTIRQDELTRLLSHFGTRVDARHHQLSLLVENVQLREEMLANRALSRSHLLLASMYDINQLGARLHSFQGNKPRWLRREVGKWADATIAANLAYANVLVVDDKLMSARLAFLREHNLCWFSTMTLSQFLDYLEASATCADVTTNRG